MRFSRPATIGAVLALLAACGPRPVAPEACAGADWRAVGVADGVRGEGPGRLDAHRASCAAAGQAPDVAAWEAGRAQGLAAYCTPAGVHRAGEAGRPLQPVCPAEDAAVLAEAHALGRARYVLRQEIARIDSLLLGPPFPGPWGYGPWPGRYGYGAWPGRYGYGGYYGAYGWPALNAAALWSRRAQVESQLAALPPPPRE